MCLHGQDSCTHERLPPIKTVIPDRQLWSGLSPNTAYERRYNTHGAPPSYLSSQSQWSRIPQSAAPQVKGSLLAYQTNLDAGRNLQSDPRQAEGSPRLARGPGADLVIDDAFDQDGVKNAKRVIEVAFHNWCADELLTEMRKVDISSSLPKSDIAVITTKTNAAPPSKRKSPAKGSAIEEIVQLLHIARSLRDEIHERSRDEEIKYALYLSATKLQEALSKPVFDRKPKHDKKTLDKKALVVKLATVIAWSNSRAAVRVQDVEMQRKVLDSVESMIKPLYTHTLAERWRRVQHGRSMEALRDGCPNVIWSLAMQVHPVKPGRKPGKYLDFFIGELRQEFSDYTISVLAGERLRDHADAQYTIRELEGKVGHLACHPKHAHSLDTFDIPMRHCDEPGSPLKRRRLPSPSSTVSSECPSRSSNNPPTV